MTFENIQLPSSSFETLKLLLLVQGVYLKTHLNKAQNQDPKKGKSMVCFFRETNQRL